LTGSVPDGVAVFDPPNAALQEEPPLGFGSIGVHHFTINATNSVGTASQDFTLTVRSPVAVGAEGADGQLWVQAPQLASGWQPLGGQIVAPPAVAAPPNDISRPVQPLFIATGTDKHLYVRSLTAGWQQLDRVLMTGRPAFAEVNGQTVFQYFATNAERSENMARYMKGMYGPEGPRIAAGFPFGQFPRLIDVGGGAGNILADILRAHVGVTGAVFDLPHTADVARKFLADQNLADRSEVITGDFFQEVTPGYDAYFIKSVLHDWDDEQSVQILNNIQRAMGEHGRVLITEIVLEPGKPIGHPHRFIDMEMMVSLGGKERSAEEFNDLLRRANMRMERVHPVEGSFFSIVEGSRG